MIKNPKVYVGFVLILASITINALLQLDYTVISLGLAGIGLIGYQMRINEDVRLVIIRNKIKRKFENKPLKDYYVVFLELTNLTTYRQYHDLNLSDYIIQETYQILQKMHSNVFLYSPDQLIIIKEFQHKTVINQRLRTEEQEQVARRIISVLQHHKFHPGGSRQHYHINCTIGTGSMGFRGDYNTITDMIKLAHFSMIRAKRQEQAFVIATEEIRLIKEDLDIFNQELEDGIRYDEIVPYFLPIVDPTTMKIIGCESLLRWEKNDYRIIEASKFKEVAEEKHLFEELDLTIIQKSLESYASWLRDDLIDPDFTLTLNVTKMTLQKTHAFELKKLVKKYNIQPQNIEFDISDHDLSDRHTIHVISQLKDFGFRVSVDAFQANHKMLQSLIHIPIDTLKIDRLILPQNDTKLDEVHFYKMIIKLSHMLGYQTMAKGVENNTQFHLAKQMQVDFIQGHYITPPLNDMKIRGFLNKYHRSVLA